MPPTPMKPSTIDSLAGAVPLGFSLSSGLASARPVLAASVAAPSADAAITSRRVHVLMLCPPVAQCSTRVQHWYVPERRANLKDQAETPRGTGFQSCRSRKEMTGLESCPTAKAALGARRGKKGCGGMETVSSQNPVRDDTGVSSSSKTFTQERDLRAICDNGRRIRRRSTLMCPATGVTMVRAQPMRGWPDMTVQPLWRRRCPLRLA